MHESQSHKPTYRALWWDQGVSLFALWQAGTSLSADALSLLWNYGPVPCSVAEHALNEYNTRFGTTYTLDQVAIPVLEVEKRHLITIKSEETK